MPVWLLAVEAEGATIETIEGLQPAYDRPHLLQPRNSWSTACPVRLLPPGIIMMAKALLDENPDPEPRRNPLCFSRQYRRCTGYTKIIDAVRATAEELRKAGTL